MKIISPQAIFTFIAATLLTVAVLASSCTKEPAKAAVKTSEAAAKVAALNAEADKQAAELERVYAQMSDKEKLRGDAEAY